MMMAVIIVVVIIVGVIIVVVIVFMTVIVMFIVGVSLTIVPSLSQVGFFLGEAFNSSHFWYLYMKFLGCTLGDLEGGKVLDWKLMVVARNPGTNADFLSQHTLHQRSVCPSLQPRHIIRVTTRIPKTGACHPRIFYLILNNLADFIWNCRSQRRIFRNSRWDDWLWVEVFRWDPNDGNGLAGIDDTWNLGSDVKDR